MFQNRYAMVRNIAWNWMPEHISGVWNQSGHIWQRRGVPTPYILMRLALSTTVWTGDHTLSTSLFWVLSAAATTFPHRHGLPPIPPQPHPREDPWSPMWRTAGSRAPT